VRGVAPRIEFNGMLSNGAKSGVFMGSAVDPVAEKSLGFTPVLPPEEISTPSPAARLKPSSAPAWQNR
jgi:hypothetical protein